MDNDYPVINLKGIQFGYEGRDPIFEALDFKVKSGSRVGLLGVNGSGKTTLFHIIMGLLIPQSGSVEIFGEQCKQETDFREVRRKIGLLFQDSNDQLFSPTVSEDIAFGPLNLGKTHVETEKIVASTLESVGLSGYEDRITYRLSGGEKRLVALATVFAMRPSIILLDEPFAGLDQKAAERVAQVLENSNMGYVMISHRTGDLQKMTDEIYLLEDGVVKTQ